MAKQTSGDELRLLLESIKSSEVVESRIQQLIQLKEFQLSEKSALASVMECLLTLWEDFTCLDISQCMLNKTLLHVSTKFLRVDMSGFLGHFASLGAKASVWCAKHLRMTLMSADDSQGDEHSSLFSKVVSELLKFSVACFSLLTTSPVFGDEIVKDTFEKFILELLTLTKDLISHAERIASIGPDLLKDTQLVLDAVTKLCRTYSEAVKWDLYDAKMDKENNSMHNGEVPDVYFVTNLIKCTIGKMSELGILAGSGGGSLVQILNLSWKGVVSLLQLGKNVLAETVNVAEIITMLITQAKDSIRNAVEAWSSPMQETISFAEAKRVFLPTKFYLINAVRISSQYPYQAYSVYREITLYILMVSTFGVTVSKNALLKDVGHMVEEHLKPTAMHLLNSLLNSVQLKEEEKLVVLDWMFGIESNPSAKHTDQTTEFAAASLREIFTVTCESMPRARVLLLGRVSAFIDLLKISPDLDDQILRGIAKKLQWFLDILVDEEIYSAVLILQTFVSHSEGKTQALQCQAMFSSLVHALKIFMIVVSSGSAWSHMELFLLENFFHPHFLCQDVIMELWSFVIRLAEPELVITLVDRLCSLYKSIASSDSVFPPTSAVRKMARSICFLLSSCSQLVVDTVYKFVLTDENSRQSIVMYTALLMEGFPLNLLSSNLRKAATERIISDYCRFIENSIESSMNPDDSEELGRPVLILSSLLEPLQENVSAMDSKSLQFLVALIHGYRSFSVRIMKNKCCWLLCAILEIISAAKQMYASDQMEQVIIDLRNLFISRPADMGPLLHKCKPALTHFVASLGHMKMEEYEGNMKSSAVWELYHMLLKERHWALVHLAVSAFGYFAARTFCEQLWRFVPYDAALSFDLESGTSANEERFMLELKVFLEKEMTLTSTAPICEQLALVLEDGLLLKELLDSNSSNDTESAEYEMMEIDNQNYSNRKRKLPDAFNRGMELLQCGLKNMGDGLSQWRQNNQDYAELPDNILTLLSHLEDTISHLAGLADGQ
ncbi:hypothetical protein Droror1_Dr00016346 [Drosera rotundifolia]